MRFSACFVELANVLGMKMDHNDFTHESILNTQNDNVSFITNNHISDNSITNLAPICEKSQSTPVNTNNLSHSVHENSSS